MVRLLTGKASSYCGTVCTEIKHAIYRRPCGECDYCRRHGLEPPAPSSAKSFEELDFSGAMKSDEEQRQIYDDQMRGL